MVFLDTIIILYTFFYLQTGYSNLLLMSVMVDENYKDEILEKVFVYLFYFVFFTFFTIFQTTQILFYFGRRYRTKSENDNCKSNKDNKVMVDLLFKIPTNYDFLNKYVTRTNIKTRILRSNSCFKTEALDITPRPKPGHTHYYFGKLFVISVQRFTYLPGFYLQHVVQVPLSTQEVES